MGLALGVCAEPARAGPRVESMTIARTADWMSERQAAGAQISSFTKPACLRASRHSRVRETALSERVEDLGIAFKVCIT